jgi:hypothetical protein
MSRYRQPPHKHVLTCTYTYTHSQFSAPVLAGFQGVSRWGIKLSTECCNPRWRRSYRQPHKRTTRRWRHGCSQAREETRMRCNMCCGLNTFRLQVHYAREGLSTYGGTHARARARQRTLVAVYACIHACMYVCMYVCT